MNLCALSRAEGFTYRQCFIFLKFGRQPNWHLFICVECWHGRGRWWFAVMIDACNFIVPLNWSKTTLNYWMMVERYPNPKEEVGGSIPGCEISTCQVANCLVCFGASLSVLCLKKMKKKTIFKDPRSSDWTYQVCVCITLFISIIMFRGTRNIPHNIHGRFSYIRSYVMWATYSHL